jgi:hypothetical protein
MTIMAHGLISEPGAVLSDIVVTGTAVEVPANRIAIYALANVPEYRQNEICNAWQFLLNGVRDRALLDIEPVPGFKGARVYSGVSIDKIGVPNRRTESTVASFNADDVAIGIGAEITTNRGGLTNHLESHFGALIVAVREQVLKAA